MCPTIRVDDEVYALLQARGEAFVDTPNTVLRRILELEPAPRTTANRPRRGDGEGASRRLARMVHDGLLEKDEQLIWERRNNGTQHTARIGEDGRLHLDDGYVADSPSEAAKYLAGYEVNGWRVWKRASDGSSLRELWGEREGESRRGRGPRRHGRRGDGPRGPRGEGRGEFPGEGRGEGRRRPRRTPSEGVDSDD